MEVSKDKSISEELETKTRENPDGREEGK